MAERCGIERSHEFESTSGTRKIFRNGSYTKDRACPRCVDAIKEDRITDFRIFVINGQEVVLPREEIDV